MSDEWSVRWQGKAGDYWENPEAVNQELAREVSRVLGYQVCDCGEAVINEVAAITGGRCSKCFREATHGEVREIEVLVDGQRQKVSPETPKKRYGSRGSKVTRRKSEHAKRRALRRLKYLHPWDYATFLAEERVKEGLEALPLAAMIETVRPETP